LWGEWASMALPRPLLVTVGFVAAVCCASVVWISTHDTSMHDTVVQVELLSRPSAEKSDYRGALREAEHEKNVMTARAVRLEGRIAALARALKRQQDSQFHYAKVLPLHLSDQRTMFAAIPGWLVGQRLRLCLSAPLVKVPLVRTAISCRLNA
jgi:hypothetical protein